MLTAIEDECEGVDWASFNDVVKTAQWAKISRTLVRA
jgi:hypothetical protein